MELVTLTNKDIRRLEIVQALAAGSLDQAAGARMLGLSVRQLKRLCRRYRTEGVAGLASRRRGKTPNNALDLAVRTEALALYQAHYPDFGPTFAAEKLRERHGIDLSRETLRRWLMADGLWQAATRRAHPRPPRARRPCLGELVQIDGSPHAWFEGRGPRCTLLLAIDDATSRIGAARFVKAESTNAYFELFDDYFRRHGLPEAFYSDRHSIFRINATQTQDGQTQVARALAALDIELICANSPQAKGRVERANRTLQNRLVKELRLHGIDDMDSGNAFLVQYIDSYNSKFAKAAALEFDAHRSCEPFNLDLILSQRFERTLTKNLTFQIGDAIYALADGYSCNNLRAGVRIHVHLQRDGGLTITHNSRELEYRLLRRLERNAPIIGAKELQARAAKPRSMPQMARAPKPGHPWKGAKLPHAWRDSSALHSGDIIALR